MTATDGMSAKAGGKSSKKTSSKYFMLILYGPAGLGGAERIELSKPGPQPSVLPLNYAALITAGTPRMSIMSMIIHYAPSGVIGSKSASSISINLLV